MNRLYSFLRALLYLPTKLVYPTTVLGSWRLPAGKYIAVSNHLKWTDILITAINIKGYRHIMAKKEIGQSKFIHRVCDRLGVIFVDRGKADLKAIRAAMAALSRGEAISIFPEGTRNRVDENLQEVKGGAVMFSLKSGAPLVPVMIYERSKAFRRNYILVGDSFSLKDELGKLTPETMKTGEELLSRHMNAVKSQLACSLKSHDLGYYRKEARAYKKIERLKQKTLKKYQE